MIIELIFWFSILLLFYTHVGYPVLLWVWSNVRKTDRLNEKINHRISVLVIAYNEADRIERRIENLLELKYPRSRFEIIVASDGSTDETYMKTLKYREQGVLSVSYSKRRGKSAVLNDLIPQADGEIVVLADARQRFEVNALQNLAEHFADPEVGAVSGELILTNDDQKGSSVGEGVGFYWKYEKFIRRSEGRIDSTIGVTGAIYAIRRELFEPIPQETILDDVLIPMKIVRKGYRTVFESAARAYDKVATSANVEFTRKVRTLAGNFQLFSRERWLLNPIANRLWIQTISHKVFRLLSPLYLMFAFIMNLFLLESVFYQITFATQIFLYFTAFGGYLMRDNGKKLSLLNIPYVFCLLNWATVVGFLYFMTGRQRVTWQSAVPNTLPEVNANP